MILAYSATVNNHIRHLHNVFEILRKEQLFAKLSKCSFAHPKVENLGHIINMGRCVATEPSKLKSMANLTSIETLESETPQILSVESLLSSEITTLIMT